MYLSCQYVGSRLQACSVASMDTGLARQFSHPEPVPRSCSWELEQGDETMRLSAGTELTTLRIAVLRSVATQVTELERSPQPRTQAIDGPRVPAWDSWEHYPRRGVVIHWFILGLTHTRRVPCGRDLETPCPSARGARARNSRITSTWASTSVANVITRYLAVRPNSPTTRRGPPFATPSRPPRFANEPKRTRLTRCSVEIATIPWAMSLSGMDPKARDRDSEYSATLSSLCPKLDQRRRVSQKIPSLNPKFDHHPCLI